MLKSIIRTEPFRQSLIHASAESKPIKKLNSEIKRRRANSRSFDGNARLSGRNVSEKICALRCGDTGEFTMLGFRLTVRAVDRDSALTN